MTNHLTNVASARRKTTSVYRGMSAWAKDILSIDARLIKTTGSYYSQIANKLTTNQAYALVRRAERVQIGDRLNLITEALNAK